MISEIERHPDKAEKISRFKEQINRVLLQTADGGGERRVTPPRRSRQDGRGAEQDDGGAGQQHQHHGRAGHQHEPRHPQDLPHPLLGRHQGEDHDDAQLLADDIHSKREAGPLSMFDRILL